MKSRFLFLALPLLLLVGCASLGKLITPAAIPLVNVATDIAVAAAVGTDKSTQAARALKIKTIAQEVLAIDEGASAPLTALEAAVNAKVAALNLPPADQLAAQALTAALTAAIQAELGAATSGAVSPTTQVAIAQVLNQVIAAASAYGA